MEEVRSGTLTAEKTLEEDTKDVKSMETDANLIAIPAKTRRSANPKKS